MTRTLPRPLTQSTCALLLLLAASAAEAHPGHAGSAFREGFLHPWLGWDHLLAMLAVGLWARQAQTGAARWALPLAFLAGAAAGAFGGRSGLPLAPGEWLIQGSLVVFGLLIGTPSRLPALAAAAVVAMFGAAHGWAHGAEAPGQAPFLLFGGGFLLATGLLHALGFWLSGALQGSRGAVLLQRSGFAIAAAGLGLAVLG